MGRITIFSADGCPHCKRVKVALSARDIPFAEISVTRYPQKRQDMLALSDRVSTPQVFFNTRHVGGANETIALLETWDREKDVFASPYERYMAEIGKHFDPSNPRLALPTAEDAVVPEVNPVKRGDQLSVELPTGKRVTVVEATEMLKAILPSRDNLQRMTRYKKAFTGKEAVTMLSAQLGVPKEKIIAFGVRLQDQNLLHSIVDGLIFDDSDDLFRLQCFATPDVINSYRIWTENVDQDAMSLVNRLSNLMNKIENDETNGDGSIDYEKTVKSPLYPIFEDAVCELQAVDIQCMDDKTKTVSNKCRTVW